MSPAPGLVAVVGAAGQLGNAFMRALKGDGVAITRQEWDMRGADAPEWLDVVRPEVVINCAGYTQVDAAEHDREGAMAVNALAPERLAQACAAHGAPLLHFSTDYVFDGLKEGAYHEEDMVFPANFYGESKAEGERRVLAAGGRAAVVRVAWVYDGIHSNFLTKIMTRAMAGEELAVVDDQVGQPGYAGDIAEAGLKLAFRMAARAGQGIYHMAHRGTVSRYGFAEAILAEAVERRLLPEAPRVAAVTSAALSLPAVRPLNSCLDTGKLAAEHGIVLPPWGQGLRQAMNEFAGMMRGKG